ncbi:TetR/AcrR family transcriptional regulator [Amycolatopsis sp. NBC_00345]|uniref:TetR family transcriptional regulator n=1 Tax=Amycolatopsis sp. NBC_00345 TaxID=2975955 RepID=UPI002E261CEC
MSARTVDRTAGSKTEGLRERKKRQMRRQLSDTATEMFLARGFDEVRVAEIAEACGVSEKTVFNYFPAKEALILDLPDTSITALRAELSDPAVPPVEAALRVLDAELTSLTSWLDTHDDPATAGEHIRRFNALVEGTPSLRAYQRDMMDQLVVAAAETLAERTGMGQDEPELKITATVLLGLWQIQFGALRKHLDAGRTPAQMHEAVTAEVRRAAGLVQNGLSRL